MVAVSIRRRARERALQALVALDFTKADPSDALGPFWEMNPTRGGAQAYAEELIRGTHAHLEEVDAHINAALENWSSERVGYIERAVLRLAVYEMLHRLDVPARVALSEAIELAKRFGAEDAPRFVNGVLDRILREKE